MDQPAPPSIALPQHPQQDYYRPSFQANQSHGSSTNSFGTYESGASQQRRANGGIEEQGDDEDTNHPHEDEKDGGNGVCCIFCVRDGSAQPTAFCARRRKYTSQLMYVTTNHLSKHDANCHIEYIISTPIILAGRSAAVLSATRSQNTLQQMTFDDLPRKNKSVSTREDALAISALTRLATTMILSLINIVLVRTLVSRRSCRYGECGIAEHTHSVATILCPRRT